MDLSGQFHAQFEQIIAKVKLNVIAEVNRQVDAQAGKLFKLIAAEIRRRRAEANGIDSQHLAQQEGLNGESFSAASTSNYSLRLNINSANEQSAPNGNDVSFQIEADPVCGVQYGGPPSSDSDAANESELESESSEEESSEEEEPPKKKTKAPIKTKSPPKKASTGESLPKKRGRPRKQRNGDADKGNRPAGIPANPPKYFRTLCLNCLDEDCTETFINAELLNEHLEAKHSILRCRCIAADCKASFPNATRLGEHIRTHTESPPWKCQDCDRSLKNYQILYSHRLKFHQEGKFVCSHAGCHFIGDVRMDVFHHYKQEHQEPSAAVYRCSFEGCDKTFICKGNLLSHERSHCDAKPYRCLWPGCIYDSKFTGSITQHIRVNHFKIPRNIWEQKEQGIIDDRNPKDYIEVDRELLKKIKR